MNRHPSRSRIYTWLNGKKDLALVEHSFGCRRCRQRLALISFRLRLGKALGEGEPGAEDKTLLPGGTKKARPDVVFAQSNVLQEVYGQRASLLDREREDAPRLLEWLQSHPVQHQNPIVRNRQSFHNWGFCEYVLEKCWRGRFDDAEATLNLAKLAVGVAAAIPPSKYGPELINDLRARAWSYQANAERILGDFRAAERSLTLAEEALAHGTGDPLEEAGVLHRKANLLWYRERFEEAANLIDYVASLYEHAGDTHAVGIALADKGAIQGHQGNLRQAIDTTRDALTLMDDGLEPKRVLGARHNLAYFLYGTGDDREAQRIIRDLIPEYARLNDRLNIARLRWMEGWVALKVDDLGVAEEALLAARDEFIQQGMGFDAALVSMELALVYERNTRIDEMRQLAIQMVAIFDAADMHRQANMAIGLFQRCVERQEVTAEFLRSMMVYLKKARDNPDLVFKPGSDSA